MRSLRKSDLTPPLIHVSVTDGLLRAVRPLHPLRRALRRQPRHRIHGARRSRVGRLRGPIGPHPAQGGRRLRGLRDPKRASQRHNISRLQGMRHLHAVVQALESRATHDLLDTLRPALAAPSPPAEAPNLHSVRPSLCGGASRRQVLLQSMPSEGAPAQPPSYPASCRGAPSVRDHAHALRTSSSTLSIECEPRGRRGRYSERRQAHGKVRRCEASRAAAHARELPEGEVSEHP